MKWFLMALLIISSSGIQGQTIKKLIEVSNRDSVQSGQGIIYGLFIQRLGFSSGGFPQDIRLINFDTKEVFSFRVKPTFKSARENIFVYHIPAGYYAILHYVWTQSKWYGGKMFTEPIYKGMAFSDIKRKAQAGQQTGGELKQFKFSVQPNTVNYVGTWNFDKEIVSFSDGKAKLDEELKVRHAMLNLKTAVVSIPD